MSLPSIRDILTPMPWYKVTFSVDDVIANKPGDLALRFTKLHIANGRANDAALFSTKSELAEQAMYFTPAAAILAVDLVREFGAKAVPAPARSTLDLHAGVSAAWDNEFND